MFDHKNTSTSLYKVQDSSLKGNISKMKEKEFKSRQMPSARICGSVAEFGIKAVNGQDCVPSTPGTLPRTPLEGGVTQGTEQRFQGRRTSSALSLLLPALREIPGTSTATGFIVLSRNMEASLISE